jgi:Na+/H+-dicarboxylate symporter
MKPLPEPPRTSVKMLGNCMAAAVVARWEGVDLYAKRIRNNRPRRFQPNFQAETWNHG